MTTAPQKGFAPVNGLNMYYEIHGTGEPLILLHGGFGLTGSGFRNTALALCPGGRGDVNGTRPLWFSHLPDSKACISSRIVFRGHV